MSKLPRRLAHTLTLALAAAALPAGAQDLAGRRALAAVTASGARIALGSVEFTPAADGTTRFAIRLDSGPFTDHFLSMREFKCIEAPQELSCHVPYPYASPGTIRPAAKDYAWLEHGLLFFFKQPKDFGAKLWNGLYFEFEPSAAGLVGRPKAIDLNAIAAPPKDPSVPPYPAATRHEIPEGARWIRALVIE
ncbi:MAG: hypothetical protein RL456_3361 [Pseudomonadota bacterium]|jgi:hypothetical protein